jgi:hypothetical protein
MPRVPRDDFRGYLVAEIARDPERSYHESWLAALETQLAARGLAGLDGLLRPQI